MLPESDNAIWGCARNPWNLDRTPGGSSGGEASLVASRSTPIGIGSDSGGSLRIPAHFTGICALKPTPERMTKKGHASLSEVSHPWEFFGLSYISAPLYSRAHCLCAVLKGYRVRLDMNLCPQTSFRTIERSRCGEACRQRAWSEPCDMR